MRFSPTLAVLVIVIASNWLQAQDAPAKPAAKRAFLGAADCFNCHLNGIPKSDDPNFEAFKALFPDADNWVLRKELAIWTKEDKHAQAFTSLLNERSKNMGKLMGTDASRDRRCLACHTGYPLDAIAGEPGKLVDEKAVVAPNVSQGISCEGCHAPSGDWSLPHRIKAQWRFLPAAEKWEKFGYADIRSPANRTRICLSCHLGNAAEGKVVTHEMYAAGHPPLPGFELANFTTQMPKHWRDFSDKEESLRNEFLKENKDHTYGETYDLKNLNETNTLLIAALVGYSENLKLAAALVDGKVSPLIEKPTWPDLAQFECYSCHHDLKDKSWRQVRKLRGAPGRPQLRAWPTPLARLAIKYAGQDEKHFDDLCQKVADQLNAQPFGSREGWDKLLKETEWLDKVANEHQTKPPTADKGIAILRDIVGIAAGDFWDYDSARQLVWAAKTVRGELTSSRSDEATRGRISKLDADFSEIEKMFVLNLMDGREAEAKLPNSTTSRKIKEVDLKISLPKIADYDAKVFHQMVQALDAKLK
ncbi:MAG: multiheme c-type cytochrome [Planctomycetaceae bacterium]